MSHQAAIGMTKVAMLPPKTRDALGICSAPRHEFGDKGLLEGKKRDTG